MISVYYFLYDNLLLNVSGPTNVTVDPYGRMLVHKYDNSKVSQELEYKVLKENKDLQPTVSIYLENWGGGVNMGMLKCSIKNSLTKIFGGQRNFLL